MPKRKAPSPPPEAPPPADSTTSRTTDPRDASQYAATPSALSRLGETGLDRLLVESVQDYAIFALDVKGRVLSWNAGAQRFKGYTETEILGKHFSLFYTPEAIADGRPEKLLAIARKEGHVEDEGWRVRKDGTRFWADVTITALRSDTGELVGYAKVTRDLTDRRLAEEALRLSEERFRLFITTVRDYAMYMLDPRGCVTSWNEGAQRIKGYTSREIIGRHFSIFFPEQENAAGKPLAELKEAARLGSYELEDWRVRKDGSMFWANVVITALRNDKGELIGFAKITRDLTERRNAEQRAIADARRVAEAEAQNRAKSEFLAAMSHELRTPLNAIGGYAELIQMGVSGTVSELQRDYLERIRHSQQHLLAIINDLLNYSRIESGQVTYEEEVVNLHAVTEAVLAMVAPQAQHKRLDIVHGPCTDEVLACADRLKTEQIMLNLLSNAVKFTPEGGRIRTTCELHGADAVVTVNDTGPGIPGDKTSEIFEPFVQLGRSLSAIREGTGLGLAISRDLARAMHGDVTVDSTVGKGSTFTLKLRKA